MPYESERVVRIRADRDGPLLVEGPVEVTGPDGDTVVSRRFVVAICTCRRSRTYPWCDTSHRRRGKPPEDQETGGREPPDERRAGCGRTPVDQTPEPPDGQAPEPPDDQTPEPPDDQTQDRGQAPEPDHAHAPKGKEPRA